MGHRTATIAEQVWPRVKKVPSGCWEFTGARTIHGYGTFRRHGRYLRAHRVAWELIHGPIEPGLVVRHKCDNPPCCNPDHLELGTQRDNISDMKARGRARALRAEAHPNARLSDQDVTDIRAAAAAGESCRQIAKRYGCHNAYVSRLVAGTRRSAS